MNIEDPYRLIQQLAFVQKKAGMDREVSELYCAYARLRLNAGLSLPDFDTIDDGEGKPLSRCYIAHSPGMENADPRFLAFVASYSKAMIKQGLPVILSVSHLALKLGYSTRQLTWMTWNQDRCYQHFSIPKPSGGMRQIVAPTEPIKFIQRWINRRILAKPKLHKCATGFRPGFSILDNAVRHANRKVVVRIDLKDFFPSITYQQVRDCFERLGYAYSVASMLANLCTLSGALPQGASTSPALANLVSRTMDERFYRLSLKLRFRYTRYADDLVFSSNNERLPSLIPFMKEVVASQGFVVNEDKVHIMRKGNRQRVTGLVVNEKPGLAREQKRLLRAMVHRAATRGAKSVVIHSAVNPDADPLNVLYGRIAFMHMIDPEHGRQLIAVMNNRKSTAAEWS